MIETLVFDKAQITCKWNYSVPKWGGACHPLTSMCGEAIVIIKCNEQQEHCPLAHTPEVITDKTHTTIC